ncbi:MAG: hypothetical protein JWP63_7075, partial [Candidatus Solibacter sp.]|nr:hypothetical protein [Candidatus Solibacter sp.]
MLHLLLPRAANRGSLGIAGVQTCFKRVTANEATLGALFLISAAIQMQNGHLSRPALAAVTFGLACCAWGIVSEDRGLRWPGPYLMLGWELVALFFARPTAALSADAAPFRMGIVFCAAAAIAACAL